MNKSRPINITLPRTVQNETDKYFVSPLESESFFGRPSRSMVIRALLEIALDKSDLFEPSKVNDYESLKRELRRITETDSTEG